MALTKAGINHIAQAIVGLDTPFDADNAYIGIGNGQNAFNADQTNLTGTSTTLKGMDAGYPVSAPPSVSFRATFLPEDANFDWNEWGIFNSNSDGVMLNRVVEQNGTKRNNQTWVFEVTITFTIGS